MTPKSVLVLKRARGFSEDAAELLRDEGTLGIWEVSPREWRAFFPEEIGGIRERLESMLPTLRSWWEAAPVTDWAARYQETLKPMAAGLLFAILPAADQENPWPERVPIHLTPGMAFGTGEHFTTASCLRLLEKVRPLPRTLLDLGCGSGILAIAARKLGVPEVAGCDIDAEAIRVARENAGANGVEVEWAEGGAEIFAGAYDCVLANIQAEVLQEMMPSLRVRVKKGGTLVMAGILWERLGGLLKSAEANGFQLREMRSDGRWASLRMAG